MAWLAVNRRSQNILLVLIALALAMAPLRGLMALPVAGTVDGEVHCAQMQADGHAAGSMPATHHDGETGHGLMNDCDGDCCDETCNVCVHGVIALSNPGVAVIHVYGITLTSRGADAYPGRTTHPPFRPPISLFG